MSKWSLTQELSLLGHGDHIRALEPLAGGLIANVWLVSYDDGSALVAKTLQDAPANTFPLEVEGLAALAATDTVAVPAVVAAGPRLLLLERLPPRADTDAAWETFGRRLAALHRQTVHGRHGWDHDNWRGRLRQRNPWTSDGHEFFAQHRLLRYLDEPGAHRTLDAADRRAVERLCARLPEIVPAMPPVLTHGDLWTGNLLGHHDAGLALVDPSVSYTWAELDLALVAGAQGQIPAIACFLAAYQELNPSPDGWPERLPLLALVELLSWVAHMGLVPLPDPRPIVDLIRTTLRPFASTP